MKKILAGLVVLIAPSLSIADNLSRRIVKDHLPASVSTTILKRELIKNAGEGVKIYSVIHQTKTVTTAIVKEGQVIKSFDINSLSIPEIKAEIKKALN